MTTLKKKLRPKAKPKSKAKPEPAKPEPTKPAPSAAVDETVQTMARVLALEIINLPVFAETASPEQHARDRAALAEARRSLRNVSVRFVARPRREEEMVTNIKGTRNNVAGTWVYAGPKSIFMPEVQILALKSEYTYLAVNGNGFTLAVMTMGACIGWVDVALLGHQTVKSYLEQVGRDALLARAEAEGRWPRATPTPAAGRLVAPPIPAPKETP